MACPTCGCECVVGEFVKNTIWCPRCGTTYAQDGTLLQPVLVTRCRAAVAELTERGGMAAHMVMAGLERLGVLEALYLPGERPKLSGDQTEEK